MIKPVHPLRIAIKESQIKKKRMVAGIRQKPRQPGLRRKRS